MYRDLDYFLVFEDFPRIGVPGFIGQNADGTCSIFINTLYCPRKQKETLRHELRHLALDHLWENDRTLREREAEAGDLYDQDVRFAPDFSWVEAGA